LSIRQLLRNESAEALGDMLITGSVVAIIAIGVVLFMDPDVSGWRFAGLREGVKSSRAVAQIDNFSVLREPSGYNALS